MPSAGTDIQTERAILHALWECPEIFADIAAMSGRELVIQQKLRAKYPPELVRAALGLTELRQLAGRKFSRAEAMWFDRTGLEQATSEAVATYKGQRFSGRVWDLCSGIGGDTIGLASHCQVIAVDRSFSQCLRTQWNAEVHDVASCVQPLCADVLSLINHPNLLRGELVHVDPDRRAGRQGTGSRSLRVEDGLPNLETLRRLIEHSRGGAIKLSPASNFGGKFEGAIEIELVSLEGECKEATVWYGELATAGQWRATSLPSGETITGFPLDVLADLAPLGTYLYDPDPAIVRSGLLDHLAVSLGLSRLDAAEEYLAGNSRILSPFVARFRVLDELPHDVREFRRYFRTADAGQIEIKCRHIPTDADKLRKQLPREGKRALTLIICRIAGESRGVVCERESSEHN